MATKRKVFRWKDLNKTELKHLKETANVTTLAAFKHTAEEQAKMRKRAPEFEPCWHCRRIAEKLGLPLTIADPS